MKRFRNTTSIVTILLLGGSLLASSTLLAVGLLGSSARSKPASVLLQEGLYAEEIEGDLDAAIKIYERIAADKSADSRYAAQAMYRLGVCYQKKHDHQKAKATFEKLITRFPKEKSIIEKVQPLLNQMSTQDPAALMPSHTLLYLEIGSPGKQIETILNMLKGTPFENPLAAIGAGKRSGGGKSPGDMMAALLNPSMMAEFKKIRGMAIGLTGIRSNNPPGVAVIYPGESDALRGMIIAGLGMALQSGEPVEGMQTLRMGDIGGAAYDDNVIIIASPIEQLVWCVKQYKGVTSEPTLASQNKAFQRLSRKVREQNAVTIWANVDRIFPAIKEQMPEQQRLLVDGFGDIGNVDALAAYLSIEENSIAVETGIDFKDGHNCLAYNLIRTPNLSKAGFEAVPPQAVALVSFALGEAEGAGAESARKAVKKLTGLDIGRELFANIEQITVFALPPSSASNKNVLAKNISPILPCLGLAVTSRNPQKTHRLFTQLLTMADLIGSMNEESDEHISPAPGKYKIGMFDDGPAYCYMEQGGKSTILTLNPEVLQASLSSLKSGKSALTAGPLQEVLSQLPPDASKLVAVNASGAIRIADAHICKSLDVPSDPNKNSLSQLFGQLAQACGKTTVQVRTGEKPNNFNLKVGVSNLPQLGPLFPLVAQIPGAMENPMLCATRPKPADNTVVKPDVALKLNWAPGTGTASHKVHFGTEIDKLSLLGEVKVPSYDKLPVPERGVTYYWRIDEVRVDGSIITGDIWSFGTGKLVAWWKFDETAGKTVADSSGSNYHGTAVHGNPIWNPDGKSGGCLDFNERYGISIPKEVFSSINKAITISVWVNGDKDQAPHRNVIVQAGAGRRGRPYIVTAETDWKQNGEAVFRTGRGGGDEVVYHAALEEWAGRWNHYAFVKDADAGFQRIYLNGRLVAEQTGTTASMTGVDATRIGIAPDRFGDQYIGKLDDLRIYNYALSAEEIQQLCGVVPGFGPVIERIVYQGGSEYECLIDFETGKLFKVPEPLLRYAKGKHEEALEWIKLTGVDAAGDTQGPIESQGLEGFPEDMAALLVPGGWDASPSLFVPTMRVFGPSGKARMFAKGDLPATYWFKTGEGNMGVLQILGFTDGEPRGVKIRYKMLQERAKPPVPTGYCKIFLPEAETAVYDLLALASGTLLNSDAMRRDVAYFERLGRGDIAFDERNGQDWLFCFRGARMQRRVGDGLTSSEPDRVEGAGFVYLYQVREVPCDFVVTTAEGDKYELKVLSRERSGRLGIHIEYWKSAEAPAEFAIATPVKFRSGEKLSRLGKAVVMYADDHNGKLPGTLQELKPYIEQDFQWLLNNVEYLGKGKIAADAPDTAVAYDKTLLEKLNGTNVLFLDAHVEFLKPEELERLGIITGKKTQAILG